MIHKLAHRIPHPIRQSLKRRLQPQILLEGNPAPAWELVGHDGKTYQHDKGWMLVVFYPADNTPGCTQQLTDLESHRQALDELGCVIYGCNPASLESHAQFAKEHDLKFPLLSDPDGLIAQAYKASYSIPMLGDRIIRTVYLVNPKGMIRLANRGTPSIPAIIRSIQALQQATKLGV